MKVNQLVSALSDYPDDMEVVAMVDYGTGYLLHPPTQIIETSEFRNDETDKAVIVLMDMVEAPLVQWRNTDPICSRCGMVADVPKAKGTVLEGQLDLF